MDRGVVPHAKVMQSAPAFLLGGLGLHPGLPRPQAYCVPKLACARANWSSPQSALQGACPLGVLLDCDPPVHGLPSDFPQTQSLLQFVASFPFPSQLCIRIQKVL